MQPKEAHSSNHRKNFIVVTASPESLGGALLIPQHERV